LCSGAHGMLREGSKIGLNFLGAATYDARWKLVASGWM
jgi:hypothetical protein